MPEFHSDYPEGAAAEFRAKPGARRGAGDEQEGAGLLRVGQAQRAHVRLSPPV